MASASCIKGYSSWNGGTSLWTGPAELATIRTSRTLPMKSLLKKEYREPTGIRKVHREGPVRLEKLGFEADEHALAVHGGPEKAILQYNPRHYAQWREFFEEIKLAPKASTDAMLTLGGFGENIAANDHRDKVIMDEHTVCIGDLIGFQRPGSNYNSKDIQRIPKMRVTGPRMPCFKLNHRFGVAKMSQYTQNKFWTGWLYSIDTTGEVEVGDEMVLLERPFPELPVARVQLYLFKETTNTIAIKDAVDTLGDFLVYDVKDIFNRRLTKGTEDMSLRLQGERQQDEFSQYRLTDKRQETVRVSEFVLERTEKLDPSSDKFEVAEPGSHIRLRLQIDGKHFIRPYSVVAGDSNSLRLGIALADESRGGSAYLHEMAQINDCIEANSKFGNTFALSDEDEMSHVFLAGGVGITAFLGHIEYCLRTQRQFRLHYMVRNKADRAFAKRIDQLMAKYTDTVDVATSSSSNSTPLYSSERSSTDDLISEPDRNSAGQVSYYISSEGRRCNIENLLQGIAMEERTHVYVCGSEKMAEDVRNIAERLKITKSRLHFEQFSAETSGDPFTATLTQSKKTVHVATAQSLLDALREAGLEVPSSCEVGNCATCRVSVKCGKVLHRGTGLEDDEKAGYNGREQGDMLSCVSRGAGTICIEL